MVEDVVGCKWSLTVLHMIRTGIHRPGAMTREQDGLSTKVLNERLAKLTRYGILAKEIFAEVPPRVEYHFTDLGTSFLTVLDAIEDLDRRLEALPPSGA